MALAYDRTTVSAGDIPRRLYLPVDGGILIYKGALVALNASGYLVPGATASTLVAMGVSDQRADNSAGADGAISCFVAPGVYKFAIGSSSIAATDVGKACYIVDDLTVHLTSGSGTRSPAGIIVKYESDGVLVFVSPEVSRHIIASDSNTATGITVVSKSVGFAALTDADTQQTVDFDAALPAGAVVLGAGANVTAIFDNVGDTASLTFDLGIKSGDTDGFIDGGSLDAVAKVSVPRGVALPGLVGAITPSIIIDSSVNLNTLTKGAAVFYVLYALAF